MRNNFFEFVKKDILIEFGNRIRELRKERSWSQEELAAQANFHRTYIGMIERGERNISLQNIERFSEVFGMSIDNLLKFK